MFQSHFSRTTVRYYFLLSCQSHIIVKQNYSYNPMSDFSLFPQVFLYLLVLYCLKSRENRQALPGQRGFKSSLSRVLLTKEAAKLLQRERQTFNTTVVKVSSRRLYITQYFPLLVQPAETTRPLIFVHFTCLSSFPDARATPPFFHSTITSTFYLLICLCPYKWIPPFIRNLLALPWPPPPTLSACLHANIFNLLSFFLHTLESQPRPPYAAHLPSCPRPCIPTTQTCFYHLLNTKHNFCNFVIFIIFEYGKNGVKLKKTK